MVNSCPRTGVAITAIICDSSEWHAVRSGGKWHFGTRWYSHISMDLDHEVVTRKSKRKQFWLFLPHPLFTHMWVLQHSSNLHKAGFRALPLSPLAPIWAETLQLVNEATASSFLANYHCSSVFKTVFYQLPIQILDVKFTSNIDNCIIISEYVSETIKWQTSESGLGDRGHQETYCKHHTWW